MRQRGHRQENSGEAGYQNITRSQKHYQPLDYYTYVYISTAIVQVTVLANKDVVLIQNLFFQLDTNEKHFRLLIFYPTFPECQNSDQGLIACWEDRSLD